MCIEFCMVYNFRFQTTCTEGYRITLFNTRPTIMNIKHDNGKPFEIALLPVKIETTETLEGDQTCCSLVDFSLQTEFKVEEIIASATRKDDETSTVVKSEPLEQRDTSIEDEHSYNPISSVLKYEIDEDSEWLNVVESPVRNNEYSQQSENRELESEATSLESTREYQAEYGAGSEVKYLDIQPRFIDR